MGGYFAALGDQIITPILWLVALAVTIGFITGAVVTHLYWPSQRVTHHYSVEILDEGAEEAVVAYLATKPTNEESKP